jgi:hypothetical protein
MQRFKKYAIGAGGMLVVVAAIVLATGSGSAVAAQITSVFVTNDAAHPVPVHEQGTANVQGTVSSRPAAPAAAWAKVMYLCGTCGLGNGPFGLVQGPSSSPVEITSLTIAPEEAGNVIHDAAVVVNRVASDATSCPNPGDELVSYEFELWRLNQIGAPFTVSFPTPLEARPSAGGKVCVYAIAEISPDRPSRFNLSGFFG